MHAPALLANNKGTKRKFVNYGHKFFVHWPPGDTRRNSFQKVNLPKEQPAHKMTERLWLMFLAG